MAIRRYWKIFSSLDVVNELLAGVRDCFCRSKLPVVYLVVYDDEGSIETPGSYSDV